VKTAGTGSNQNFGYTGEILDAESGLLYLRARYYDPSIGRFISADPYLGRMAEPVTQNRYIYVHNNPLLYSDPTGMCRYDNKHEAWSECMAKALNLQGIWDDSVAQAKSPEFWSGWAARYDQIGGASLGTPITAPAGVATLAVSAGFKYIAGYLERDPAKALEAVVQGSTVNSLFDAIPPSVPHAPLIKGVGSLMVDYSIDSFQSSFKDNDGGVCPQP